MIGQDELVTERKVPKVQEEYRRTGSLAEISNISQLSPAGGGLLASTLVNPDESLEYTHEPRIFPVLGRSIVWEHTTKLQDLPMENGAFVRD